MIIDEAEARRRLESEENLLNRIQRRDSDLVPEIIVPSQPDLDLEELLDISNPLTNQTSLSKLLNPPQKKGPKGLHRDTQAAIGVTAGILGTTKASRLGGVSIEEAHSYERGYTSPNDISNPAKSPKQDLQDRIIEGHGIIVDRCFNRLMKSLDLLDDEKLASTKRATDLTQVAKNLSGIIAHATQATQDHVEVQEKSVHFHIMKPEQSQDSDYPTIEINSEKEEIAWQEKSRS